MLKLLEVNTAIIIDFKDIKKCKKIVNELYKENSCQRQLPEPFETGILVSGTSIKNTKFLLKHFLI